MSVHDTTLAGVNGGSRADADHPRDIALDLFGSFVREHHPLVWSGGLVELMAEFGFTVAASRIALSRLVDSGLIARVQQGRLVHYTITDRGQLLLAEATTASSGSDPIAALSGSGRC